MSTTCRQHVSDVSKCCQFLVGMHVSTNTNTKITPKQDFVSGPCQHCSSYQETTYTPTTTHNLNSAALLPLPALHPATATPILPLLLLCVCSSSGRMGVAGAGEQWSSGNGIGAQAVAAVLNCWCCLMALPSPLCPCHCPCCPFCCCCHQ